MMTIGGDEMKKYTPKQLAKELKIENKQEMRNILRDYKDVLSCDYSTPQYYRSGKDNTVIKCGRYKTYDDDDLIKLRQIIMFKQLGVKPSEIIEIMKDKKNGSAIDKLIGMLEEREKEIREQLFMAKHIKAFGGMKGIWTEILLLGKTPHQYAAEVKEAFQNKYVLKLNIGMLARMLSREELENQLKEMDLYEIPTVKEYLSSDEFAMNLKQEKIDLEFLNKIEKLMRILKQSKGRDEDKRVCCKSIQEFVFYCKKRYGIGGVLDFGLFWYFYREGVLTEAGYNEVEQATIDAAISRYIIDGLKGGQELSLEYIMFSFDDWIVYDCCTWMQDVLAYIEEDQNSEACELVYSFVCDEIEISKSEELLRFETYLRVMVEHLIQTDLEEKGSIEEEDATEYFESLLSKFYTILLNCLKNHK